MSKKPTSSQRQFTPFAKSAIMGSARWPLRLTCRETEKPNTEEAYARIAARCAHLKRLVPIPKKKVGAL